MDVEISLQDFRDQRPNIGLSTLTKSSNTFLNIIYIGRDVFKCVVRFEEVLKWTPFTASVTYCTCDCIRFLDTRFFHGFFPLSIGSSSSNGVNKDWGLT
jgi:hypothetical protein